MSVGRLSCDKVIVTAAWLSSDLVSCSHSKKPAPVTASEMAPAIKSRYRRRCRCPCDIFLLGRDDILRCSMDVRVYLFPAFPLPGWNPVSYGCKVLTEYYSCRYSIKNASKTVVYRQCWQLYVVFAIRPVRTSDLPPEWCFAHTGVRHVPLQPSVHGCCRARRIQA